MTLSDLSAASSVPRSLFDDDRRRERLSEIVDRVNERMGAASLYFVPMFTARNAAPTRISFTSVPDETEISVEELTAVRS